MAHAAENRIGLLFGEVVQFHTAFTAAVPIGIPGSRCLTAPPF